MDMPLILSAIDEEISKLQQVRFLLATTSTTAALLAKRGPGRPKKAAADDSRPAKIAKRVLSPEARKKIADAQKKRWAAAAKKSTK
jgi:hypothetical protein